MKKFLFASIVLSLILISKIFAQANVYHPFPENNAIWYEQYEYWDPDDQSYTISLHFHKIVGDSTFNGIKHVKLINHYGDPEYFYQDTINKKVYFTRYEYSGLVDTLIYDFSLSPGDTLSQLLYGSDYSPDKIFISSVDSVQLENREWRRRFNLTDTYGYLLPNAWIEGIGSTGALFGNPYYYTFGNLPFRNTLICQETDSIILYSTPNFLGTCPSIITTADPAGEIKNHQVNIFPNLALDQFTLKGVDEFRDVTIYDVLGRVIYYRTLSGKQIKINLKEINIKGLCLIRITTTFGFISTTKIIVTNN